MTDLGSGTKLPKRKMPGWLKFWIGLIAVMGILTLAAWQEQSQPMPTAQFRTGDVVAFRADTTLKAVVDKRLCYRGKPMCKYSITYSPRTGKWPLVTRSVNEHLLMKVLPEK